MRKVKFPVLGQLLSRRCLHASRLWSTFWFMLLALNLCKEVHCGLMVKEFSCERWSDQASGGWSREVSRGHCAALSSTPSTEILTLFVQQPASNRHQFLAHLSVPTLHLPVMSPRNRHVDTLVLLPLWDSLSPCCNVVALQTAAMARCDASRIST
jgi:hypothetical protein